MNERASPPPPHDPGERELVATCDDWLVLGFARSETKHAYFAPRGLLHLQLWHPAQRVSARPRGRIVDEHHVLAPPPTVVRSLERWFVHRFERLAMAEQA